MYFMQQWLVLSLLAPGCVFSWGRYDRKSNRIRNRSICQRYTNWWQFNQLFLICLYISWYRAKLSNRTKNRDRRFDQLLCDFLRGFQVNLMRRLALLDNVREDFLSMLFAKQRLLPAVDQHDIRRGKLVEYNNADAANHAYYYSRSFLNG